MSSWTISPLRYPGGKGALAPFLGRLLQQQTPACEAYVEPFAGGAGAALRLLYDEYVSEIVLNDINPGIAAFWRAVFENTSSLADRVLHAEITIRQWREQQALYRSNEALPDLDLGFATFFLNRTNRSGILDGGPIGGMLQTGVWKMDARFNREALAWKVREIGRYRNRVTVLQEDALDVVRRYVDQRHFIYADPPYLQKGGDLYVDTLSWADHQRLAAILTNAASRWMVTYDHDPRVLQLYPKSRRASFNISHRAREQHVGQEFAIFANSVRVSDLVGLGAQPAFVDEESAPWLALDVSATRQT